MSGWDAGIRTPIRRSRVCSLTVRRRPNDSELHFSRTHTARIQMPPRSTLKIQDENVVAGWPCCSPRRLGRVGGRLEGTSNPQGYVSDFANVIDPASKAQLEAYCAEVQRATGVQMALVTIPSLQGEPIEDVANTIARAWGVGRKGRTRACCCCWPSGPAQPPGNRLRLEPIMPDGLAGIDAARNAAGAARAAATARP